MKKVYILLSMLAVIVFYSSCNDEWKEEQFENYISFKAPINNLGVTPIYVPYYSDQVIKYQLPLVVSGSLTNDKNVTVHIGVDSDTLVVLNEARFQGRKDHHYTELASKYFSIPETVEIKAGENTGLMQIDFKLQGIDMINKWMLPLTIQEDESYGYTANPRKHYKKALLHVIPFNGYSGPYGGTALNIYFGTDRTKDPIKKDEIQTYVVDESSMFFYAGNVDENRGDLRDDVIPGSERSRYKINAKFNRLGTEIEDEENVVEYGELELTPGNPDSEMELKVNKTATYRITEDKDAVRPYLVHRYVSIENIDYQYTDYTIVPGQKFVYTVAGTLTQLRKINTQIPDQDQAIEW